MLSFAFIVWHSSNKVWTVSVSVPVLITRKVNQVNDCQKKASGLVSYSTAGKLNDVSALGELRILSVIIRTVRGEGRHISIFYTISKLDCHTRTPYLLSFQVFWFIPEPEANPGKCYQAEMYSWFVPFSLWGPAVAASSAAKWPEEHNTTCNHAIAQTIFSSNNKMPEADLVSAIEVNASSTNVSLTSLPTWFSTTTLPQTLISLPSPKKY